MSSFSVLSKSTVLSSRVVELYLFCVIQLNNISVRLGCTMAIPSVKNCNIDSFKVYIKITIVGSIIPYYFFVDIVDFLTVSNNIRHHRKIGEPFDS